MKRKLLQIGAVALILLSFTVFDFSDTVEPDDSAENTLSVPTAAPEPVAATPNLDAPELILVNRWNAIPDDYTVHEIAAGNNQTVDKLCYDALMNMLGDCQAEGLEPLVCSGYRDLALQTQLYENKIARLVSTGFSRGDAESRAGTEVAYPGTSEHHTGLAVDLVDMNYQGLDEAQEQTAVQQWLMKNSWKYGFILRYPNGKSDITGIIYEPWHYRYVGLDADGAIYEQGICLEEYLAQYK